MKNLLLGIFIAVFLNLKADHILGYDVSYKSLGNDTFLITTRAYKDCNSSQMVSIYSDNYIKYSILTSNCLSYIGNNFSDSTLTTIRDVTPSCLSIQSKCQSVSSSYPFGIKEYTYYNKIYLGNANVNCCQFRLVTDFDLRLSSLNTMQTPYGNYINIYLNRCINSSNSSPVYNQTSKFIYYTNTNYTINNFATDADGDSLSTSLSIPDANSNTCVYNNPYSPTNPFNSSIGHTLDHNTGEYNFRPGLVQTAVVAYRTEEFRKINGVMVKLGEIYREHVLYILSSTGGNAAPQISSNSYKYTLCPGQQTCFDINTADANSADSVFLSWSQSISGVSFTPSTDKQQKATFCWTPATNDARSKPYLFTAFAKDNHCPTVITNTKTFTLLVAPAVPTNTRTYINIGCGNLQCKANIDSTVLYYNPVVTWTIPASGGSVYTGVNITHRFPQNGTYIIKQVIAYNSNCNTIYYDTFVVTSDPVLATPIKDSTICQQTIISITPNIIIGKVPFVSKYNGVVVSGAFNYLAIKDSSFVLEITDSNGCIYRDTFTIFIKPITAVNAGNDFSVCKSASANTLSGVPSGGVWSGVGVSGNLFNPNIVAPGVYPLIYSLSNANGCTSYDTLIATVKSVPTANAGRDTILCLNDPTYSLNGTPSGGTWSIVLYPTFLNANQFLTGNAGSGTYTLIYTVQNNGCIDKDTVLITITTKPNSEAGNDTSICEGSNAITLSGTPFGGEWSGSGVSNNIFNPLSLNAGIYTLLYKVTKSGSACFSIDSMHITLKPLPIVNAGKDTSVCKSSNTYAFQASPSGGIWSGPRISGSTVLLSGLGIGSYHYIYTVTQNGCVGIDSMKLNVVGDPQPAFTANPKTGTKPLVVSFTNQSTSATNYVWDFGDPTSGTNNISTLTNPTHTYNTQGNYSVKLQANSVDGCTKDTTYTNHILVNSVGIKINNAKPSSILIYPNPATESITISGYEYLVRPNVKITYTISNVLGENILKGVLSENKTFININGLSRGVYFVEIGGEVGRLFLNK